MWYEIEPHCPICGAPSPPHKLCVSPDLKILIVAVCLSCRKSFETVPNFPLLLAEIVKAEAPTLQ